MKFSPLIDIGLKFVKITRKCISNLIFSIVVGKFRIPRLQCKVWLKELLTITENKIKMASGVLPCLRILKPSSHFYWTHYGTDHYFGQFLVRLVVFLTDDELIFHCCLKKWFLKPVSKFWDLHNLSTFQIFLFFCNSAAVFSCVCFLGEKWPALASLSRKNKHSS